MDIKEKAASLKNFWSERDSHIVELYELRRLIDNLAKEGFESAVTNDPKNIVRAATYLLASAPIKHRIPSLLNAGEQEKNAVCERALKHIWRDKDRQQRLSGRRLWRWELTDLLLMTGWYAVFVDVMHKSGVADFRADIWNPSRTYPEFSDEGLVAVYYEYELTDEALRKKATLLKWELPLVYTQNPSVAVMKTVGNLWLQEDSDKVTQSVFIAGETVAAQRDTSYKTIPVFVGAVGGEGIWGGYGIGDKTWKKHYAESILEANFAMFNTNNKWLTYYMQIIRDTVQGLIKHVGGVAGSVKGDDVKAGRVIDLVTQEDVVRMPPVQLPADHQTVLRIIGEKIQQGGFNWTTFGSAGVTNLSGIAINQLKAGLENVIGEQKDAIQALISTIDTIWLTIFKQGNFKELTITGKKLGIPGLIREQFNTDTVPEDVVVEAEFALAAPRDTTERLVAARQAQPDGRLLDPVTILEDILDKDDAQMILARLDEVDAAQTPEMKTIKMVKALRQLEKDLRNGLTPDNELADLIGTAWKNMLANLGSQPGQATAENPPQPPNGMLSPEAAGKPRSMAQQMFGRQAPQAGQPGLGTEATVMPGNQPGVGAM